MCLFVVQRETVSMSRTITRRSLLAGAAGATIALRHLPGATQTPFTIATSMPILQDIVANIAGDAAAVFSIMPANADPHTWEAAPEDLVRLTEASAFIYNGADLEPFVETGGWQATVQDNAIPQLAVVDHVELIEVDDTVDHGDHEHDHHGTDPHIWLDPLTIVQAVPAIAAWLAELDTENAATYAANAEAYVAELEALHSDLDESLSQIPEDRRQLLVFHDAWRYFAARYHFEVIGIVLENPDAEVSAQEMVHLLETMEEHDTRVIFAEPQFSTSVLDVLMDEADIEIVTLLTDSFTEDAATYIDLMRFNRDQLVSALAQ